MLKGYIAEYLRISDDDDDLDDIKQESDSIVNQRNVIQLFISQDEELLKHSVKEFCDDGYSGVNFKRPAFQQLLKEIRENKIACIIVKDFSRMGRNYIEVGDYLEQIFPFFGVRVISITDHYDSEKSTGGIEVGFKTLIHDLYSKDLSKKVKSVKKLHQKKGYRSGGNIPFGYKENQQDKNQYQIDEESAVIVKMIYELAVRGNTTGMIAKHLNERKIDTPGAYQKKKGITNYSLRNSKENLWTAAQVRELLQNEVYIGTYVCHKQETIQVRESARLGTEQYIRHENAHEPIVSREVFDMASKAILKRKKRGTYEKKEQHIFKGKVKCGCCGYGMNHIDRVITPYYICRMGESCGSKMRIDRENLELVVLKSIQQLATACQVSAEKRESSRTQTLANLSRLKEEKRILSMKQERCRNDKLCCYKQYKEGGTLDAYREKQRLLDEQIAECAVKLLRIDNQIAELSQDKGEESQRALISHITGIMQLTRELVDELIERIDVYGEDRIEISWKFHIEV